MYLVPKFGHIIVLDSLDYDKKRYSDIVSVINRYEVNHTWYNKLHVNFI